MVERKFRKIKLAFRILNIADRAAPAAEGRKVPEAGFEPATLRFLIVEIMSRTL
jgi:hypothetical protein